MKLKDSLSDRIFGVVNAVFLILCFIAVLYPLYFVLIASVSEPYAVGAGKLRLLPQGFTLEGYANVFRNGDIWIGYRNAVLYTVVGTLFNLALTLPAAYSLSKKKLPFRTAVSIYFLFTMFFSGGLIPYYLLIRWLGLFNKPYTLIVLGGVSIFNIVVTRTYFQTAIPDELYDAAYIDGASELRSFFTIAIPLAAPIIAVITLYYAVGHWNDYFSALLYLSNKKYFPLQLILRNILIQNQSALAGISTGGTNAAVVDVNQIQEKTRLAYMAESMKYALIYIASVPMLILYPFVQKHFVRGVMVGSLKG
jgi:putative aldouronate transport system permease protein